MQLNMRNAVFIGIEFYKQISDGMKNPQTKKSQTKNLPKRIRRIIFRVNTGDLFQEMFSFAELILGDKTTAGLGDEIIFIAPKKKN